MLSVFAVKLLIATNLCWFVPVLLLRWHYRDKLKRAISAMDNAFHLLPKGTGMPKVVLGEALSNLLVGFKWERGKPCKRCGAVHAPHMNTLCPL